MNNALKKNLETNKVLKEIEIWLMILLFHSVAEVTESTGRGSCLFIVVSISVTSLRYVLSSDGCVSCIPFGNMWGYVIHLCQLCHLCNYTSMWVVKSQQASDKKGTHQEVTNWHRNLSFRYDDKEGGKIRRVLFLASERDLGHKWCR